MSKIVLGYCSGEQVDAMFMRSVIRLLQSDPVDGVIHVRSGPRIATARNAVVETFLRDKSDAEWLLMLDTDMVFAPHLAQLMLSTARDDGVSILGGLCFGGGYTRAIFPTMYVIKGDTMVPLDYVPQDQLVKVDATGAACLLVHRSVYESMIGKFGNPHQWFAETLWNGREMGEDLTFCLRAKLCGFDTYVHTGIQVGHARTKVIGLDDWLGA